MRKALINSQGSLFRHRGFVWMVLFFLSYSFIPSISSAQQPTATISALSGNVLINGQPQQEGTALNAGDVIETQAGASLVLELSDGSLLEIGENTKVDLADLAQTVTGARTSLVKLMWGRIRAKLSPGHQQAGSSFTIESPNALIGVKFSQPDVEVSYDSAKQETVALALTVALAVKNLLTDEEKMIPVGSTAIISALGIEVITGVTTTGIIKTAATVGGTTTGIGAGAMVAVGVAATGGVVAVVASSGDKNDGSSNSGPNVPPPQNDPFTGTFKLEGITIKTDACKTGASIHDCTAQDVDTLVIQQNGTSLTGDFVQTDIVENCCTATFTAPMTGTVLSETSATLTTTPTQELSCELTTCKYKEHGITEPSRIYPGNTVTVTLVNNGTILRVDTVSGVLDFIRQ